ncbi:MAG: MFS transporter [Candidatus Pacearchaeota archaeon]|nr:MFS transporter [Candidatus Pacearchaeota archaeon]
MKPTTKNIKSNLPKFLIIRAFQDASLLWIPIIYLFYNSIGLNLAQIGIIASVSFFTTFLLEVPTGVMADKIGRKKTLVIGGILTILFSLTLIFANSFYEVFLASLFLGSAIAINSGADTAIIYDSLKQLKKENQFKEFLGKHQGIGLFSGATALLFLGLSSKINFKPVFIIVTFLATISTLIILTLKEPKVHSKKLGTSLNHFIESTKEILSKKILFIIFSYTIIVVAIINGFFRFHQIYANQVGIKIASISLVYSAMFFIAGISSFNIKRLERFLGLKLSLILIPITLGLSYILMGTFFTPLSILFVFLESIIAGISLITLEDLQNKLISSEKRATILSVSSFFQSAFKGIFILIIGVLAQAKSLRPTYIILGLFIIILGTYLASRINSYYKTKTIRPRSNKNRRNRKIQSQ